MKKITLIFVCVLMLGMALMPSPAMAQTAPHIVATTRPMDGALRDQVNAWLVDHAPHPSPFYAVTYSKTRTIGESIVSLAALNITSDSDAWTVQENGVWFGTILVGYDGQVTPYGNFQASGAFAKRAAPMPVGGARSVRFPWAAGSTMMYGRGGVSAVPSSEMVSWTFVGGTDMGSGVANSSVFASAPGTVDYICEDETVTMRVTGGDESIMYGNLNPNATMGMGETYTKGELIGTLVSGPYSDNCGSAAQSESRYSLYMASVPSDDGDYRIEDCTMNVENETWTCVSDDSSTTTVTPGEFLEGGGGVSEYGESAVTDPGFWDYLLSGVVSIWHRLVVSLLPDHQAFELAYVIYGGVKLTLKLGYIILRSNVNMTYLAVSLGVIVAIKTFFGAATIGMFLVKTFMTLVRGIG